MYADLDLEALKPLDNWTHSHHCILPEETYAHPFLLNKMRRANTMITLLACRPQHPYFKRTIDNLGVYPKLRNKLLYVDDMYLMYNKSETAHASPENGIHLAHPNYFLPTFDPGWKSKFKGEYSGKQCTQSKVVSDRLSLQKLRLNEHCFSCLPF